MLAKPLPLYPTYVELNEFDNTDYPEVIKFIENDKPWFSTHWHWGKSFLQYIGRNKSEHTYDRFRNDVEKFLLWAFLIKNKPIDEFRKTDILDYADFCWQPPVSWISINKGVRLYWGDFPIKTKQSTDFSIICI